MSRKIPKRTETIKRHIERFEKQLKSEKKKTEEK